MCGDIVRQADVRLSQWWIWRLQPSEMCQEEPTASIFNVEDAGRMLLQNEDAWLLNYTAFHPWRLIISWWVNCRHYVSYFCIKITDIWLFCFTSCISFYYSTFWTWISWALCILPKLSYHVWREEVKAGLWLLHLKLPCWGYMAIQHIAVRSLPCVVLLNLYTWR